MQDWINGKDRQHYFNGEYMNEEKILIYDIETSTPSGSPDASTDVLRYFGAYSYVHKKFYYLTDVRFIREIIKDHDVLVGFNTMQYDNQVLYNNGLEDLIQKNGDNYTFNFKVNIDMYDVFKKRAVIMKIKSGMLGDLLMSYSLDYISKTIGIVDSESGKQKDFDYSILNKESYTEEDKQTIIKYLKRDLEVTKKMYDWLEDYFKSFKDFLVEKDIETKKYLTCSTAVFAYKAICKATGILEEYTSSENLEHADFGGGYVSYPAGEEFSGEIYCLDYNSLYPSIMHQCNIYSIAKPGNNYWNGNGVFQVTGKYNADTQGKVEKLLKDFYEKRLEFKKNKDAREYSVKIIINTTYGILGNEVFKNLSNTTSASDVTLLGRQWVKLARNTFRENGYTIIYTDTDSVYLLDPFSDKDRLLSVKNKIIDTIKANVPFPYEKFDMGIDDEISHIWFFKGKGVVDKDTDIEMDEDDIINKPKNLMKKNYIYLTKSGDIKVKNLGVRKKSSSALTIKIFWDYLVPKIKEEKKVIFPKSWFVQIISELLANDLGLAAKRFKVLKPESYKLDSQLQSQIARAYGPGIHFLIPNKKLGVGIGKKYCTISEFNNAGLKQSDIDLAPVWKELDYFIENKRQKTIFQF